MLNIYYGRENINKEKFVYDRIAAEGFGPGRPVIVIVPDQYTLEAERQAFRYLQAKSLVGLDVFSMSRLGHSILKELGGGRQTFIDKYGRQMLLTRIARREDDNLQIFKGNMAKSSFVEMANNFISELKQYGARPETLTEIIQELPEEAILRRKLTDLSRIYACYQEEIAGKYTDSEDYIDLYVHRIGQSRHVRGARVWVYGFDSFAPKSMEVLGGLMAAAEEVNVVLTADRQCRDEELFALSETVMRRLAMTAEEVGCAIGVQSRIGQEYQITNRCPAVKHLEQELFATQIHPSDDSSGLTITEAANLYNEAESAAAFILHLLRDEGYRYRDIVVICNDQSLRASIAGRVFEEYGLDLFHDNKRGVLNSALAVCLVSLLTAVQNRYRTSDIFMCLKSGLMGIPADDVETLENYALKYRIKGSMWKKPFRKGEFEYGEQGLAQIEEIRKQAADRFGRVEELVKKSKTVREFVTGFYYLLTEELGVTGQLEQLLIRQQEYGQEDLAEETRQIWTMVCGIFDQIVELIGEDPFDLAEFIDLFTVGLSQIEVGVLPSSIDDLMMGTMQRTRSGDVRAMVVIGANDGVLPAETADEGLFAVEELETLADMGYEICKVDTVRIQEERLAIYRNLAKPSEHLWISYSLSNEEGGELRPSDLVETLQQIFPDLTPEKDIINREEPLELVGGRISSMRHLMEAIRGSRQGQRPDPVWTPVQRWFRENEEDRMALLDDALHFRNDPGPLKDQYRSLLFREEEGDLSLSPSRIEGFARCPFSYFIRYGLSPEERRVFEADSREIGDLYHACLMRATSRLTREDRWDEVTEEECRSMIRAVLNTEVERYRDGLFSYGNEEKYKVMRIEDTCTQALWMLVEHVRAGRVKSARYEIGFGKGRPIKPVEIQLGDKTVYIEGKIDRLDRLGNDRLKVIDYKSGNLELTEEEVRAGYRLQLMLYMKAARGGDPVTKASVEALAESAEVPAGEAAPDGVGAPAESAGAQADEAPPSAGSGEERLPAGVFYFHIQDPRISGDEKDLDDEAIREELRKKFQLKGIVVNDSQTINEITGPFEKSADVLPIRYAKDGTLKSGSGAILVTDEEFRSLQNAVDAKIYELSRALVDGDVSIHPMRLPKVNACTYCELRSICRFDLGFSGCRYNDVRKK